MWECEDVGVEREGTLFHCWFYAFGTYLMPSNEYIFPPTRSHAYINLLFAPKSKCRYETKRKPKKMVSNLSNIEKKKNSSEENIGFRKMESGILCKP